MKFAQTAKHAIGMSALCKNQGEIPMIDLHMYVHIVYMQVLNRQKIKL